MNNTCFYCETQLLPGELICCDACRMEAVIELFEGSEINE